MGITSSKAKIQDDISASATSMIEWKALKKRAAKAHGANIHSNMISQAEVIYIMKELHFETSLISHFLKTVDRNKDKKITKREFEDAFAYWKLIKIYNDLVNEHKLRLARIKKQSKIDPSQKDYYEDFDEEDIAIDTVAFTQALKKRASSMFNGKVLKLFMIELDKNKDGLISMNEIESAYRLAKDWIVFTAVDRDESGTVDLDECIEYFTKRNYNIAHIKRAMKNSGFQELDFNEFRLKFTTNLNGKFFNNTKMIYKRINVISGFKKHKIKKKSI